VSHVGRERLLAEQVLAGAQCLPGDVRLGGRDDGDVDHVDRVVAEQGVERVVDAVDAMPFGDVLGTRRV
jgi:hypothetical protein